MAAIADQLGVHAISSSHFSGGDSCEALATMGPMTARSG
jgi:hypothetical protein